MNNEMWQCPPIGGVRCPTPCDADCDAPCHEGHYPTWKQQNCGQPRCPASRTRVERLIQELRTPTQKHDVEYVLRLEQRAADELARLADLLAKYQQDPMWAYRDADQTILDWDSDG